MSVRSPVIQAWWPATQSLDLVRGKCDEVAAAVHAEVARFTQGDPFEAAWETCETVGDAFAIAEDFTNVPSFYLVLPTATPWTVLWNNSYLCDGYDSLCHCLSRNQGLTTLHWSAHDKSTTFQPGAQFHYRAPAGDGVLVERSVAVVANDGRWSFHEHGDPIAAEDLASYSARRKKDRLNEVRMVGLLRNLGASPWDEQFYAVPDNPVYVIRRLALPAAVSHKSREEVLALG